MRLKARFAGPLKGRQRPPGDKSISHRALILGALAKGRTEVEGLLESEDVMATAKAARQFGATVERLKALEQQATDVDPALGADDVFRQRFHDIEEGDILECFTSQTVSRVAS